MMFPRRFRPCVTALEGREVPAALLQVINDSPYTPAAKLDIYINNLLVPELTGLGFRQASPYLTEPSAVPLVVSVRAAGATAATQPFLTQTFTLADGSATVAVVLGDPNQTQAAVTKFQLLANNAARTAAGLPERVSFVLMHGSPDAPPVDVKLRGTGILKTVANDLAYPGFASEGYSLEVPSKFPLDVTLADGVTRLGSYLADLRGAAGKAVTVLTSGFVGTLPAGTAAANTFGLLAVGSDGTATLLPATSPPPLGTSFAVGAGGFSAGAYTFGGQTIISPVANAQLGSQQERVALADVDGDGNLDQVFGSSPVPAGGVLRPSFVSVLFGGGGGTPRPLVTFQPFEDGFTRGLFVAAGDLNGDGKAEIVVTPDQGGGPVVAIYSGAKLPVLGGPFVAATAQLSRFFGIDDPTFRGGARATIGDISGDGSPDLIVAAGFGGGPRVAVYDGATLFVPQFAAGPPPKLLPDFFVFEQALRNGVFVTAGDVNGDGAADVIVGGGPGGGPRVFALSGRDLTANPSKQTPVANFFAGDPNNRDGVRVAAKDLDGDQFADLVVGLGSAGTPQVRGFRGKDFNASVTGTTPPAVAALDLNPFATAGTVYVG